MKELDETLELLHREARDAPASLDDARAKLIAAIDADSAVVEPATRRRKLMVPLAAAAAAVIAAAALGFQISSGPADPADSADPAGQDIALLSATEVLAKAADLSVGAVDQPVGPNQYRYIVKHAWVTRGVQNLPENTGYTYLWEQQIERWIPANPRDTWRETRKILDSTKFLGGSVPQSQAPVPQIQDSDHGKWQATCGDFFPKAKPRKVCGDPNDWDSAEFYAKLPRDADGLYSYLADFSKIKGGQPSTMFHTAILILGTGLMPAELRAQFYRAIAKIPGIKVLDHQVNLDGRTGIALGLDDERELRQLIIDPRTGEFIGERSVAGAQPYPSWIKPGTETGASAIRTEVVDGLGQTK